MVTKQEWFLYLVLFALVISFCWQISALFIFSNFINENLNATLVDDTKWKLKTTANELRSSRQIFDELKDLLVAHLK